MLERLEHDRRSVLGLLRQEWMTKADACWLTNTNAKTWQRYMDLKAKGDPAFKDFPTTYKCGPGPKAQCKYKVAEVVHWTNSWRMN